MPALVNISVGSCRGTSGLEGTTSCSFLAQKCRKAARMSLVLAWPRLVWLTLEEAACSVLAVASLALAPLSLATFALVCLADVIGKFDGRPCLRRDRRCRSLARSAKPKAPLSPFPEQKGLYGPASDIRSGEGAGKRAL